MFVDNVKIDLSIFPSNNVLREKQKHGSSEVEAAPNRISLFLGPKRIVFLSVTRIDGYVVAINAHGTCLHHKVSRYYKGVRTKRRKSFLFYK